MDMYEISEAVDDLGRAWQEFQATNDARLKEIEKKGSADPLLSQKADRINKRLDKIEVALNRTSTVPTSVSSADYDPENLSPEMKAFDAFLRKGVRDQDMDQRIKSLEPEERKVLALSNDAQAGYLAPAEFVREIIKGAVVFSPIRTIARVRQTTFRNIEVPRRSGTFSAVWVAEQGTRSETEGLTYALEEIPTSELYGLVDLSAQLNEDSAFDMEGELEQEFSEQFGVAEGAAFVTGNGSGKPEGFLSNSDVSSDVSGSASTIADTDGQADGLITLQHNLKEAYARNANWVLNRKTIGAVRKLKDSDKNYIWQPGNLATGVPNTLLGDPYVECTDMPDVAAGAYPIAYGDFRRAYLIVDRVSMSVLRDPYTQATSGTIRYIARRRVGGQVVLAEAIRKLQCAAS